MQNNVDKHSNVCTCMNIENNKNEKSTHLINSYIQVHTIHEQIFHIIHNIPECKVKKIIQ